jgi:hypothetical protein
MIKKNSYFCFYLLIIYLWSLELQANRVLIPSDLTQEILSESVPSAFALENIQITDYEVYWINDPIDDVNFFLEDKSLQWVRIMDVLVLPRARLKVQFLKPTTFRIDYGGFSHGGESQLQFSIPVALLSSKKNKINIQINQEGKIKNGILGVRFKPKSQTTKPRLFQDSSCSRYNIKTQRYPTNFDSNSWVYFGCRFVSTQGENYRTSALEMYIFWDGYDEEKTLKIDGLISESILPSLWALRLGASPGHLKLIKNENSTEEQIDVSYSVSDRHYLGSLGLGLGPYFSEFSNTDQHDVGWNSLLTLYGSYFINETTRMVAFDATSISNYLWSDLGLYLSTENATMFDQRCSMNLLFGGHILAFRNEGRVFAVPSYPQGFEFIYRDAFMPGRNFSLGGFVYPEINGRSYYNMWIRWGGKLFWELNYLSAKESFGDQVVNSKSIGITIGYPIVRFF